MNYLQNGVIAVPNTSKEISNVVEQALHENDLTTPEKGEDSAWRSQHSLTSKAAQERHNRFEELCLRNNVLLLPDNVRPMAPLARMGDSFLEQHRALLD
jgi:hypothetical protein